mmetsp:Transcript_92066/g.298027  ORF Transcript_92066/g.298027 Transcript_92066/m.298027 type:complete len:397 (+) Transcript_92066:56-1246(+)
MRLLAHCGLLSALLSLAPAQQLGEVQLERADADAAQLVQVLETSFAAAEAVDEEDEERGEEAKGEDLMAEEGEDEGEGEDEPVKKARKGFMQAIRQARRTWKAHKKQQMEELEPWRAQKIKRHKMLHTGERRKAAEPAAQRQKPTGPPSYAEKVAQEMAPAMPVADAAGVYGKRITLLLRDPMNATIRLVTRSAMKMRVLFHVVQRRLGLPEGEEVSFMHKDRHMSGEDTAESFGLAEGDIIEVQSDSLEKAAEVMKAEQKKADEETMLRVRQTHQREIHMKEKAHKAVVKARKEASINQQRKTRMQYQQEGKLHLIFKGPDDKTVRLGFKRKNWLRGAMAIASKRFGLDPEVAHFMRASTTKTVKPHDSAHTLGMKEDEVIIVMKQKPGLAQKTA